jgi:hypothetical protein
MHPVILQQLAAERTNDMIAKADGWRRARQARRARQSQTSGPMTRDGLPRAQAEPGRPSASTAAAAVPANMPGPLADSDQGRELALAERGHTQTR